MKQSVIIIGSGIGGLGSAALLAKAGYEVTVLEKNANLGGRANIFEAEGYTFDMGPSWYLMPDVFEQYFNLLEEDINDHLELIKLSPSYRVFFSNDKELPIVDIHSDLDKDLPLFEQLEPGVTPKIKAYLERSGEQYEMAKETFMYRNLGFSLDFLKWKVIKKGIELNPFQTMQSYLNKWFESDRLKKILEYTLVFLGSDPAKTPAMYNIMNAIDFNMGVYYPKGGIYEIVKALERINKKHGTSFHTNTAVSKINIEGKKAGGVQLENGDVLKADLIISNADLWFTETRLLEKPYQTYPEKYWERSVLSPSAFIMYLGLDRELDILSHHNLRFGSDWKQNFKELFDTPQLPEDPSYYICKPTETDPELSPEGTDNLFVLVPIPPGLTLSEEDMTVYRQKILDLIKTDLELPDIEDYIVYERSFWSDDFRRDYNAYKGTALGLAHTLKQTLKRPLNYSKKVKNLYYVGAGTSPGIGMPICLISAELVYKRIQKIKTPKPLSTL
ncbi:phytoene desaturase family protein [Psychroserpens sp.]|uniref:phytoene desaturase family protein n=1 Tax=Psychroserpens sp. TaxID=2020870 RepID=UPI001B06F3E2|nr:phytoene desaturase family protein [Psychroserpens sp.]MBO6606932.1 phytoene desaturase [Psychroserpens sp.]MBO6654078.1 phytoene desaturase [Psychroserpens sp.]MBO6682636.1 phytoene desaturase [Psychroserpens sp.]MBO6750704.1 phytoene desaturase [Psychroserpens sp.]MBO6915867.1 phytoene desaturase [Psychroserpens sp.]